MQRKVLNMQTKPLANDISDFLLKHGPALAQSAKELAEPMAAPFISLADVEAHRSKITGTKFEFYKSQKAKIAGTVAVLKQKPHRAMMICDCGTGKTPMSLASLWALWHDSRQEPRNVLVMCPAHLCEKWKRETEQTIPGAQATVIRSFSDLVKLEPTIRKAQGFNVWVLSKETAKLGCEVDKPAAAGRLAYMSINVRATRGLDYDEAQDALAMLRRKKSLPNLGLTTERGDKWIEVVMPRRAGYGPQTYDTFVVERVVKMAACPRCGAMASHFKRGHKQHWPLEHYLEAKLPVFCDNCHDKLATHARGVRSNPHIDRYIQRHMKGVLDALIADEVHELAGADTEQGNALGTLASAVKWTIVLTGTLINGKASSLHAILWRLHPKLVRQRGFSLEAFKHGSTSALARNETPFTERYGVMQHEIVRSVADSGVVGWRGRCGRRRGQRTEARPKPGIAPNLFNHFLLGRAVFMNLSELGANLPTLQRELVPCRASDKLRKAYNALDDDLQNAIKANARNPGGAALRTLRVSVLDSYLDQPWNCPPCCITEYSDGQATRANVVATPEDLGEWHSDTKDAELLRLVKRELAAGRKCAIYTLFTDPADQTRDIRHKIMRQLRTAGVNVLGLPDNITPAKREAWLLDKGSKADVLVCHPARVMTGLDMLDFPTLIWYQVGYNAHVLRQASARARRPNQTKPCRVVFLYYENTIQEQALSLMGEKEAASQALEGTFDTKALRVLLNGGKDDSILSALAQRLDSEGGDARNVWARVDGEKRKKGSEPCLLEPCEKAQTVLSSPVGQETIRKKAIARHGPDTPAAIDLFSVNADACYHMISTGHIGANADDGENGRQSVRPTSSRQSSIGTLPLFAM
jgi:hypothetical protein